MMENLLCGPSTSAVRTARAASLNTLLTKDCETHPKYRNTNEFRHENRDDNCVVPPEQFSLDARIKAEPCRRDSEDMTYSQNYCQSSRVESICLNCMKKKNDWAPFHVVLKACRDMTKSGSQPGGVGSLVPLVGFRCFSTPRL